MERRDFFVDKRLKKPGKAGEVLWWLKNQRLKIKNNFFAWWIAWKYRIRKLWWNISISSAKKKQLKEERKKFVEFVEGKKKESKTDEEK